MARKEKNIHYIYKTTCNVTGRWYVGMHSTCNLEDGYMGSGKRLRYSIRKHGLYNHSKEILEYFGSRRELVLREIEIVTKELISDGLCMNLKEGGTGGFSSEEHKLKFLTAGEKTRINLLILNNETIKENHRKSSSENIKKSHRDGKFKYGCFEGKTHSDDTKKNMSNARKNTGKGSNNSQYGTIWITKNGVNKKIKKETIETYINEGWVKGRNNNKELI